MRTPTPDRQNDALVGGRGVVTWGERTEKAVYLIEAVVLGGPTLGIAVLTFGFVVIMAVAVSSAPLHSINVLPILAAAAMAASLCAWVVLSGHYLMGGRLALCSVNGLWWLGLAAGMTLSVLAAWSLEVLQALGRGEWSMLALVTCGLPLWIPSLHLISLRLRK